MRIKNIAAAQRGLIHRGESRQTVIPHSSTVGAILPPAA